MDKKILLLIAAVLLVGMAGCSTTQEDTTKSNTVGNTTTTQIAGTMDEGTHRFIDEEAGTVCYIYEHDGGYNGAGGMSCVPIEDTNFGNSGDTR